MNPPAIHLAVCRSNTTHADSDCTCGAVPKRSRVDVALGRLMAAIEDAMTETRIEPGQQFSGAARNAQIAVQFWNIVRAKESYDAARLAAGGAPPAIASCDTEQSTSAVQI